MTMRRTWQLILAGIGVLILLVASWLQITRSAFTSTSRSSSTLQAAAVFKPRNLTMPTITGTVQEGEELQAATGLWSNNPTSYEYQWSRCNVAGIACSDIDGATSATYVASIADVGFTLRVTVVAINDGGRSNPATSAATGNVSPAPPVNTSAPTITGTAQDGETLTASPGSWNGNPTSYSYVWLRCDPAGDDCQSAGASGPSYQLSATDVGHTIRVRVTASNAGGDRTATSAPTSVVIAAVDPPANVTPPTIVGSAAEGAQLTVNYGTWTNDPTHYTVTWSRCSIEGCQPIATGSSYTLTGADTDFRIRATVEASNAAGAEAAISAPAGPVARQPEHTYQANLGAVRRFALVDGTVFVAQGPVMGTSLLERDSQLSALPTRVTVGVAHGDAYARIYTVARAGNVLYFAGSFDSVNGEPRQGAAAINLSTGELTDWDPTVTGTVMDLAVGDGVVYVAGWLGTVGGQPRTHVAAVDATTGALVSSFDPGTISGNAIREVELGDGQLYVAGPVQSIAGVNVRGLAALHPVTGAVLWSAPLQPYTGGDEMVGGMQLVGSRLYVTGKFVGVAGEERENVVALNAATGTVAGWQAAGAVSPRGLAIAARGDVVYVANPTGLHTFDALTGSKLATRGAGAESVDILPTAEGLIYATSSAVFWER